MTFDEFAGARLQAVLRFATAVTGDPDLAKDLVQEVLIRVNGQWQKVGQLDRPEAYIRKMVVNEYLSWRRRSWRLIPSGMSSHAATEAILAVRDVDFTDRRAYGHEYVAGPSHLRRRSGVTCWAWEA